MPEAWGGRTGSLREALEAIQAVAPSMGGIVTCNFCNNPADRYAGIEIMGESTAPDLFVDPVAKATYELDRSSMKLCKDGEVILKVWRSAFDGNSISVTRGSHGFQDERLLRISGPVTGRHDDWFSVSKTHGRELSKEEFRTEFKGHQTIHITGFRSGIATTYDKGAIERLKRFGVLAWNGDGYDATGFTRLVPLFLHSTKMGVAVAFVGKFEIPRFNIRWHTWMAKYPGRIFVVPIDEEHDVKELGVSEEAKTYCGSAGAGELQAFVLGRAAMKISGSLEVVSLGGEGSLGNEAQAGFPDDVHWTVYALSRGEREKQPSLCDFARKSLKKRNSVVHMDLVMGMDPNEADAFHYDV